jgi:IS30 family transposase
MARKMVNRRPFSDEERKFIQLGLSTGKSKSAIAKEMGRPKSSVIQKIRKRSVNFVYTAEAAKMDFLSKKEIRIKKLSRFLTEKEISQINEFIASAESMLNCLREYF